MLRFVNYSKFLKTLFQVLTDEALGSRMLSTLKYTEKPISKPELDYNYLCSPENTEAIKYSINNRKTVACIEKVKGLHKKYIECTSVEDREVLKRDLEKEALRVPNRSHPSVRALKEPKIIRSVDSLKDWKFPPLSFATLSKDLNLIKTENLTCLNGPRSYYLLGSLAELEEALIRYTLDHLLKSSFVLVSVPDLLPRLVIENCGMETKGERTQVYALDGSCEGEICLSGTAEMGIGYFLQGKEFDKLNLPLKLASVSRCFRAETSKVSIEKGIFRVHQFSKVEMFGVSDEKESDLFLEEFCRIQETLFSSLGLQLRVMDMPENELGAQAYRKFDIECYMPGKKYWGEISSASNCTDYQTRRLGIRKSDGTFPHTINGTACAVPRLLVSILETHQNKDKTISVPEVLIPYLGYQVISKSKMPKTKSLKIEQ